MSQLITQSQLFMQSQQLMQSQQQSQFRQACYLQEMGISQWVLADPKMFEGYQPVDLELPDSCKLLLISPMPPSGEIVTMFERVLKSIHLRLDQALFIQPSQLSQLGENQLEWVWFAGCETSDGVQVKKVLNSPLLSEIDGNVQHRRDLWQQICSYD